VSAYYPPAPTVARLRQARAQQQAVQRWLRLLGPLVLTALFVLSAFQNRPGPGPGLAGHDLVVSAAVVGFAVGCLGVSVSLRRTGRAHVAAVAVLVASSAAVLWAQPTGPGTAGVFVGILFLAVRLPARAAIGLPVAAFVVLGAVAELKGLGIGGTVPVMAVLGGFFGMVFLANRLGEANEQAERLLLELEHSRAAQAQAAGLAERQRLAREMHDVLAHSLSGLMLQLEAARMLANAAPGDPRLPGAIDRAHHLGKTGLEEARRAIGMLRGDELPGPERLAALAFQFQHDRGISCRLTVSGEEHELGSQARLALYRVAQEALTNIAKHAHPDWVELHLVYQPGATRLIVEDFAAADGSRPPSAGGGGYGLTGMRERAELLGGTLITEATCRGFRVELEVPA